MEDGYYCDEDSRRAWEELRGIAEEEISELIDGCELIEFVSRSNGKNRPRRQPREVNFLKRDGQCYPVIRGEIRPRKSGGIAPDVLANEVLKHLPEDERTTDRLLELARRRKTR